jgi:hypothetical protein
MFSNKYLFFMFLILIFLLIIVIFSYFIPDSIWGKMITHFNSLSSVFLIILTFFYVLTTNFQLRAMNKQLNLMKENTNLQIQPIPVPIIERMELERIRPFVVPENKFMKMTIKSRFFCDFQFKNVGNGTALNVIIFPTIIIENFKIPSPSLRPELTYCISDEILDQNKIHIFMFDTGIEIAKAIINNNAKLELNIFYKNIFNVGFHEIISYNLFINKKEEREKWKEFFNNNQDELYKKQEKHNVLKPIDKEEAKIIFNEVSEYLKEKFSENLNIQYQIESRSYTINIVDYIESVKKMEKENENNFKNVFKDMYKLVMMMKEKEKNDYCA